MRRRQQRSAHPFEIAIQELGFKGDGVAILDGERLLVPGALPGERWQVRRGVRRGWLDPVACLVASTERARPPCGHFGMCGGCTLQHLRPEAYAELKRRHVRGALRARHVEVPEPIVIHRSPLGSRRRLRLGFDKGGRLGFRQRHSSAIVAIESCPIARPGLVALFAPLRQLLPRLDCARKGGEVTLTALDSGVEVVLHLAVQPSLAERETLAAFAEAEALVRLAITVDGAEPEPVAARLPAALTIAGLPVSLPPAAFLQATAEGEACLQAFVVRHLEGARRVVDLFAGVGTLSLPLAGPNVRIRAFDVAAELVAACRHPRIEASCRNLFQAPLAPSELAGCDAIILDPPRAGAEAQVPELARSGVDRIVYVSCAPASFARDAAVLVAGGYRLAALEIVDQFVYTAEVELAAFFTRQPKGA